MTAGDSHQQLSTDRCSLITPKYSRSTFSRTVESLNTSLASRQTLHFWQDETLNWMWFIVFLWSKVAWGLTEKQLWGPLNGLYFPGTPSAVRSNLHGIKITCGQIARSKQQLSTPLAKLEKWIIENACMPRRLLQPLSLDWVWIIQMVREVWLCAKDWIVLDFSFLQVKLENSLAKMKD